MKLMQKKSESARTEYRALTQRLRGTLRGFALNELSAWLNTSQILQYLQFFQGYFQNSQILHLHLYTVLGCNSIVAHLSLNDKALMETSYGKDHFLQV